MNLSTKQYKNPVFKYNLYVQPNCFPNAFRKKLVRKILINV